MNLSPKAQHLGFGTAPFWHVMAPLRPARTHPLPDHVDVAIVGGGFTGLWTALELRRREPSKTVAVFEAQHIGYGASGRNAGYMTSWMHHSPQALVRMGVDTGQAIHHAAVDAVRAVLATIEEFNLDCDLQDTPVLWTGSSAAGDRRVARDLEAIALLDSPTYRALTHEEIRERSISPVLSSGVEDRVAALINPAKLVRSLGYAVAAEGAIICENTPILDVQERPDSAVLITPDGEVRADAVVLARNAWAAGSDPFQRRLLPFYVYDVYTEPLTDDEWKEIGWHGREGVLDRRFFLINYRPTIDGRIMFGGVDGRQPYAGRISERNDAEARVFANLRQVFDRFFPSLHHVRMQFGHGGPIAMTPSLLPQVGRYAGGRILYSHGYCGHGVTQSRMCAGIVVDLILDEHTERSRFPFVNSFPHRYPREPFRYLGGLATLAEGRWYDKAADEGADVSREPWLLRTSTALLSRAPPSR